MNGWILLLAALLILGFLVPLWILVQFALISEKTHDEIHGDD